MVLNLRCRHYTNLKIRSLLVVFLTVLLTTSTDAFVFKNHQQHHLHLRHYHHGEVRQIISTAAPQSIVPRTLVKSFNKATIKARTTSTAKKMSSTPANDSQLFNTAESTLPKSNLGPVTTMLTKIGMMLYIASMCVALPLALLPQYFAHRMGWISKLRQEKLALASGQFCARWLLRLIPFCKIKVIGNEYKNKKPEPSIWVCNHTSALDVFVLLATDLRMRGPKKRPIKIVYWQGLEDNPITKLLFRQSGFIPVQMAANKAGEDNQYDASSFRKLLKDSKRAFQEGFDIGILPEGQLNPDPESGLLPVFGGAYTLAKLSKRPIQFMALNGCHKLWHPEHGMTVTGRNVQARVYPQGRQYSSSDEFVTTFEKIVGEFGTHGKDLEPKELESWLDGSAWKALQKEK